MTKTVKRQGHDMNREKYYRNKPFEDDKERLEYLFKLCEEMIAKENNA